MPFREANLQIASCAQCGAPIDTGLAVYSKASGRLICKSCEGGELVAERAPVRGDLFAYLALTMAALSLGAFLMPFDLHGKAVGVFMSAFLAIGAIICATTARTHLARIAPTSMRAPKVRLPNVLATIAIAVAVVALFLFAFSCLTECSSPRTTYR